MLQYFGFTVNGDGENADKRCMEFQNAADVVEASEYKRLCNKLSREERRVRKLKKRIEELEKGTKQ